MIVQSLHGAGPIPALSEGSERAMAIRRMNEDDRPIAWLECIPGGSEAAVFRVGDKSYGYEVTEIKPYTEVGQGAYVPWLAVFSGSEIVARVNAANVTAICYK